MALAVIGWVAPSSAYSQDRAGGSVTSNLAETAQDVVAVFKREGPVGVATTMPIKPGVVEAVRGQLALYRRAVHARAFAVLVPGDRSLAPFADVYKQAGLAGTDLLIVSNGDKWQIQCAAIGAEQLASLTRQISENTAGKPQDRLKTAIRSLVSLHGATEQEPIGKQDAPAPEQKSDPVAAKAPVAKAPAPESQEPGKTSDPAAAKAPVAKEPAPTSPLPATGENGLVLFMLGVLVGAALVGGGVWLGARTGPP